MSNKITKQLPDLTPLEVRWWVERVEQYIAVNSLYELPKDATLAQIEQTFYMERSTICGIGEAIEDKASYDAWDDYQGRLLDEADDRNPKLSARIYADKFLSNYYGHVRAQWIASVPQFIHKMKYGCGVSYRDAARTSKGKLYPIFDISYTEHVSSDGGAQAKRRRVTRAYNDENKKQVEHEVTLLVAKIQAKNTFSLLHESALNFEYDLEW